MLLKKELSRFSTNKAIVITAGWFDGLHLSHRKILDELKKQARQLEALSVVAIFHERAGGIDSIQRTSPYVTSLAEKIAFMEAAGIDTIILVTAADEVADYSTEQFLDLLTKYFKIKCLVIGDDFPLGNGNPDYINRLGQDTGITIATVSPVVIDGRIVNTNTVHDCLIAGDMRLFSRFTGRYFRISGKVIPGMKMGRRLGFPTANIELEPRQILPSYGMYAAFTEIEGESYQSVAAIGIRPPFANRERTVEVHILDFERYIYGKEIKIDFIEQVRDNRYFGFRGGWMFTFNEDIKNSREILSAIASLRK